MSQIHFSKENVKKSTVNLKKSEICTQFQIQFSDVRDRSDSEFLEFLEKKTKFLDENISFVGFKSNRKSQLYKKNYRRYEGEPQR